MEVGFDGKSCYLLFSASCARPLCFPVPCTRPTKIRVQVHFLTEPLPPYLADDFSRMLSDGGEGVDRAGGAGVERVDLLVSESVMAFAAELPFRLRLGDATVEGGVGAGVAVGEGVAEELRVAGRRASRSGVGSQGLLNLLNGDVEPAHYDGNLGGAAFHGLALAVAIGILNVGAALCRS